MGYNGHDRVHATYVVRVILSVNLRAWVLTLTELWLSVSLLASMADASLLSRLCEKLAGALTTPQTCGKTPFETHA